MICLEFNPPKFTKYLICAKCPVIGLQKNCKKYFFLLSLNDWNSCLFDYLCLKYFNIAEYKVDLECSVIFLIWLTMWF